jgi:hypothetical protein
MTIKLSTNIYGSLLIFFVACLLLVICCAPANAQSVSNNLVLSWSANTFVPSDYPGKSLPTYGSLVDLTVDAASSAGKTEGLNFIWFLNGDKQIFSSGKNQSEFIFRVSASAGASISIGVQVQDDNGNTVAGMATAIPVVSSEVILYSDKSSSGYGSQSRNSIQTAPGQEVQLLAAPYFFNVGSPKELEYQWIFEGKPVIKVEDAEYFSLKIDEGTLGSSIQKELSVNVENPKNRAQQASSKIDIVINPHT